MNKDLNKNLNFKDRQEVKRSSILKRIIIVLSVILLLGIAAVIYLWNLPHKKVENMKGVNVTAVALAKDYAANEQQANAKYLNKAIEVTGVVSETDKNQDGGLMIILQADDPTTGVQCSMRDKGVSVTKGQNITIKGFCSGNGITGVSLTDCVVE
jgi:uncharacterized protein YpmB